MKVVYFEIIIIFDSTFRSQRSLALLAPPVRKIYYRSRQHRVLRLLDWGPLKHDRTQHKEEMWMVPGKSTLHYNLCGAMQTHFIICAW
jgi:hypothetical protein